MTWLLETRFAPFAQVVIPSALIAWLALVTARSRLALILQVLGTVSFLIALSISAIWLLPPWWTPYVYAAVLIGVAVRALLRWSKLPMRPISGWDWVTSGIFLMLGVYSSQQALRSYRGNLAPREQAIDLGFPFSRGEFQVAQGGSDPAINAHLRTRDIDLPAVQRWRGVGYALDIVAVDGFGLRASGHKPDDLGAYRTFGLEVSAPCSGVVITAVDGLPDVPPQRPDFSHPARNHVLLRCGDVHVLLAHLRFGTVRLRAGDSVRTGDVVGEVGNSGGTFEPHLHIHAQQPGTTEAPMSGAPVPMTFGGRFLARGDRVRIDAMRNTE